MTLQTDLQAAVAKTTAAADKLHQVVHGDAASTVETENGPVKTVAKTIADNEAAIDASRAELDQKVANASASALAAAGSAAASDDSAANAAERAAKIPDPTEADSLKSIRVNIAGTAYELVPGGGDVVGPAGAEDGALARFNGATGKLLKAGGPAQTSEIADAAVTSAKLAAGAVTAEKIAPGAVDLATRVAKAGDAMTGDLSLPNLIATGTVRSGAAGEIGRGWFINLGVGMVGDVLRLLWETGVQDGVTVSVEHGDVNGFPLEGKMLFGVHVNADAILDPTAVFDMYSGGLLDAAFLGMAQVDAEGNVNVSRFADRVMGCGGFIDITARTRRIFVCGALAAGGAKVTVNDGRIRVEREGKIRKVVPRVEHVTLDGKAALKRGQSVTMITERGLFSLTERGWILKEIPSGLDIEADLAPMVGFPLKLADRLGTYPPEVLGGPGPRFTGWLKSRLCRQPVDFGREFS